MMRRLDVQLNGYAHCLRSDNPILRNHKSKFFRKQCGMGWTLLPAMERFAPNGIVRRRARRIDRKYRETIGEPSPVQQLLARNIVRLSKSEHRKVMYNPSHYRPKEEPFKRYVYDRSITDSEIPYRTEWPTPKPFSTRKQEARESARYFFLDKAMRLQRSRSGDNADPLVDEYLIRMVSDKAFGFGL